MFKKTDGSDIPGDQSDYPRLLRGEREEVLKALMRLYDVPYTAPHVSSLSDADLNQMIVRLLARGPQWIKPMPELEYRCPNQLCKCGSFRMFSPDEGVHIVLRCARCQTLIVVGKIEGLNAATELEVIDPCGDCGLTASEPKK